MDFFLNNFELLSNGELISQRVFFDHCGSLGFPYLESLSTNCFKLLSSSNAPSPGISHQDFLSFTKIATSQSSDSQKELVFKFMSGSNPEISLRDFSHNIKTLQILYKRLAGSNKLISDLECKNIFKDLKKTEFGLVNFDCFSELWDEKNLIVEWNKFVLFEAFIYTCKWKNDLGCKLEGLLEVLRNKKVCIESEYFFQVSPFQLFLFDEPLVVGYDLPWEDVKNEIIAEYLEKGDRLLDIIKEKVGKLNETEVYSVNYQEVQTEFLSKVSTWFLLSGINKVLELNPESDPKIQSIVKINNTIHTFRIISNCPQAFNTILSTNPSLQKDLFFSCSINSLLYNSISQNFSDNHWELTSGKSTSYFYSFPSNKFLLKSISEIDNEFLTMFIKSYSEYLILNPESLLCRLCGWFTYKEFKGFKRTKQDFFLMNDILEGFKDTDYVFDIKGSVVGRSNKEKLSRMSPLKDLDFNKMGIKVMIREIDKVRIMRQLVSDCEFLEKMNITDYSLILGMKEVEGVYEDPGYFRCFSECGKFLYSFGIIDYFSVFSLKKKFEMMFKSSFYGPGVSCLAPKEYRVRFLNYIEGIF